MRHFIYILLFLTIILFFLHSKLFSDNVYKKSIGTPTTGEITVEDIKGVTISFAGSASTTVSWNDVEKIEYDNIPTKLRDAQNYAEQGKWHTVYEMRSDFLNSVNKATKQQNIFRQHALFYKGYSEYFMGDYQEAEKTLTALFTEFKNTRFFVSAAYARIRSMLKNKKEKQALELLKQLSKQADFSERDKLEFRLLEAEIYEYMSTTSSADAHRMLDAKNKFTELTAKNIKYNDIRAKAYIGLLRCLEALKSSTSEIKRNANEIIEIGKEAGNFALATAYNYLGNCLANDASSKQPVDLKLLKEAIFNFLKAICLYKPKPHEDSSAHEKAYLYAIQTIIFWKTQVKDSNEIETLKTRALRLYFELKSTYPYSPTINEIKNKQLEKEMS